ncbi:MAG: hypothetical protein G01um10145_111 [Microgenomates group bacterium Gr01-1014_5]|nr:MAG: hypothetical protein G01um10145_111 [Microgenomates group bacterium Gr01-1014_5]
MFSIPRSSFEILQTKGKGRGVFALQSIKSGTVIGEYSGKYLPYHKVDPQNYEYLMYLTDEVGIVADKTQIGVHLLNHSCDPNCTMDITKKVVKFVTICDIQPGEELTISYRYPQQDTCSKCEHKCFCGSPKCLGTMHTPKDVYDL